ncbi:MAG: class I SAM-dependent methyltransferase [Chloroflexi bacterium]|nr:class I SAM-dependent methyltransferase [Chloroflexota bacterium]
MEFYLNAIDRCGGSVLELGVGTGRIAIPAAAMGHDVMGVDVNRPMLDRARLKSTAAPLPGKLQLIEGDMSKIDLPHKDFDLVIIPAHTLALLTDEHDQAETLIRCAEHMALNAALIFNLFSPTDDLIRGDSDETFLLGVVEDDENGVRHVLTGTNEFDTTRQINRCTQVIETLNADGESIDREVLQVLFRYLHHHQVIEMLETAGLQVIDVFGDFDGSPLTDDSEEMIYICRLK